MHNYRVLPGRLAECEECARDWLPGRNTFDTDMVQKENNNRKRTESGVLLEPKFAAMVEIATSILKCGDLDEILSVITKGLIHILAFDRSSVALCVSNESKMILRDICKFSGETGSKFGESMDVPLEPTNVLGWVALTKEPIIRNDIEADSRFKEVVKEEMLQSDMIVPLTSHEDVIGTLNIGSYKKNAFTASDLELLNGCAKFVSMAIEHVTLLKEANELGRRYRLLQENANDMIMLINKNSGKIVEANRKCELVIGYSREDLLKKSFFDLFAMEDLHQARKDFINMLSRRAHSFIDRKMISRDNRIVFVDINSNLLRIHDDVFIQVIVHDISQRRMLEQQIILQNKRLQEINKQLREVDKMKTEFLANISHELRTPLSIIIAYVESMNEPKASEEDKDNFLDIIQENSEKLLGLINNLLDLSKFEISGTMLNMTLSHVHDVIRSVWPKMEREAGGKNINLNMIEGEDVPVIYFDNNQVQHVLISLISNAIKFTQPGGIVKVSTRLHKGYVQVKVADNGAGIPGDELSSIFTTFHQVDGSTSRRWGGMGIGLAMAKHIIVLHKGDLWAESEYGKGSEFTFSLPAETECVFLAEDDQQN